ncbi:MAG: hypothetical protein C1O27_002522 [Chloroflexi bacterium]|nr:MAG: hypothetical protein C1O27_002522 [Chloroflexota bacterium]
MPAQDGEKPRLKVSFRWELKGGGERAAARRHLCDINCYGVAGLNQFGV